MATDRSDSAGGYLGWFLLGATLGGIAGLLLTPRTGEDNRSYLTVALGCTGGQHRSVYMAERLAAYFSATERVVLRHREQSQVK